MTDPDAPDVPTPGTTDPVLLRRRQIERVIGIAQRIGYTLFALFLVLVVAAFATSFASGIVTAATVCLIAGTVILAPAMFFAYTVKAADREDREGDWR